MTGFAWVPSILIFTVVHNFFEQKIPTTLSKAQMEEVKERAKKYREEEVRKRFEEEERKKREQKWEERRRQAYEQWRREDPAAQRAARTNRNVVEEEMKRYEDRFLRYLFSMLAKLAKADGRVDPEEVKTAEKVFVRFEFAVHRRQFCSSIFNTAKDDARTIYWYAEQFGNQVTDGEVCIFVYELLWDVACADGWLHPTEKEILQRICDFLHIPKAYYDINYRRRSGTFIEGDKKKAKRNTAESSNRQQRDWRRPYVSGRSSILDAYEIIECDSTATIEELKSAYRKVAKRYHPDLLRANGVPEEMIAEANERMAQVNAAWDDIRKLRSI